LHFEDATKPRDTPGLCGETFSTTLVLHEKN